MEYSQEMLISLSVAAVQALSCYISYHTLAGVRHCHSHHIGKSLMQ